MLNDGLFNFLITASIWEDYPPPAATNSMSDKTYVIIPA